MVSIKKRFDQIVDEPRERNQIFSWKRVLEMGFKEYAGSFVWEAKKVVIIGTWNNTKAYK